MFNNPTKKTDTKEQFIVSEWVRALDYLVLLEEPMPPYFIDIYLPEWDVGIELDGPHHRPKKDRKRDTRILDEYGVTIIRFKNAEITLKNKSNVIDTILSFTEWTLD